jgi:hypothetical protein
MLILRKVEVSRGIPDRDLEREPGRCLVTFASVEEGTFSTVFARINNYIREATYVGTSSVLSPV